MRLRSLAIVSGVLLGLCAPGGGCVSGHRPGESRGQWADAREPGPGPRKAVWVEVATSGVPGEVMGVAEAENERRGRGRSLNWHGRPAGVRVYRNRGGAYRVAWLWIEEAGGHYLWEWVEVSRGRAVRYGSQEGAAFSIPESPVGLGGW